jgi:hypothetical protein
MSVCPEHGVNHWCGRHSRPDPFCGAPHPDPRYHHTDRLGHDICDVFCRLLRGHDGEHSAFTWSVSTPDFWPADA